MRRTSEYPLECNPEAGLPAQKGNVDRPAGPGDAPNDVGDAFGDHSAAGDVVRHEEGAGAHDGDVVDHHADEVLADGVVDVERPCDRDLRADAVGRGREQGSAVRAQIGDVHHPGEAAEPADDHAGERPADGRSHELDGRVVRLGVHAGRRVRGAGLGAPRPSRCGQACAGCALGGRLSGGRVPVGGRRRVGRAGASGGFVVCHASSVNKSDPAAAAAPATSMG